ncbi:MAG: gamma-glutamyltransferase [Hyphomicrobiales bacterium]|nr:gamma-glutamyltransferase [Hyphomicrobiales bacterium]
MPGVSRYMILRPAAALVAGLLFAPSGPVMAVSPPPVQAANGMVVTSQHLASAAGISILKAGGNAVDAAVAVGYALAVVHPCCGNLGGGGFATLDLVDGTTTFFNFREKAPLAATATMYLDDAGEVIPRLSLDGYKAVGVPGTVLGLDTMLQRYGTLSRQQVMAPVIELAEEGYVLTEGDAAILAIGTEWFETEANVAAIFLDDGAPWQQGERLVQSDLAATLKAIAADGPDVFYKGAIADAVVAASTAHGGILAKQDFADYTVVETEPVRCSYRGYEILSAPPPSSGGTIICEILNILEGYPIGELGYHSAAGIHRMTEAMRQAFVDRNSALGDPAFVENPVARLVSKDYAAAIRDGIDLEKAIKSEDLKPGVAPHEGTDTTHFSIIDKAGNAVSLTYTINAWFGARVIAGDTGFFLNDEMDDFAIKPGAANMFGLVQGSANAVAPGKRPLSSMSPTVVLEDGKPLMILGSRGGPRIITIIAQAIMNVVDHGMDIKEAVNMPRIHHQWLPDTLFVERRALSPDTVRMLTDMGHTVEERRNWGAAHAIMIGSPRTDDEGPAEPGSQARPLAAPDYRFGGSDDRNPAGAAIGH